MKTNILFTVTNLDIIDKLKGLGIDKFVYPLSFFCVGIPKTFNLSEIKEQNSYIYINRVLDTKSIDLLKKMIKDMPSNIKGVIFTDLGVLNVFKDYNIEKVLFINHFNTNYESINYYFDYVDEIIVSPDLTENEYDEIIKNSKKKVSLFTFGLVSSFYSRRTLITNHNKHFNISNDLIMNTSVIDKDFISIENEYGTVMYHYPYYDGTCLLNKDCKYNFYFPILLDDNKILELASGNLENIKTDKGFLNTKTIYKLPPKEGR